MQELKNEFITSLLSVQNKRRQAVTARLEAAKNRNKGRRKNGPADKNSTYLTTVIPYTKGKHLNQLRKKPRKGNRKQKMEKKINQKAVVKEKIQTTILLHSILSNQSYFF